MSMNNTATSGYIIKALECARFLPSKLYQEFTAAIAIGDVELVDELLGENVESGFPMFETFKLNADDETTELEHNTIYICFHEDDLYVKTPTNEHEFLLANGIKPEFQRWIARG
jgi:hypothetical protein